MRFPHIGEQVFEELGDQNLIQCLSVSRNWRNLLEDCKFLWIRMILGISNPVNRVNYYKSKRILKKSNSQDVKKMQIAALETITNGRSYLWLIQKFHIGDIIYFAIKSGLTEIFKEKDEQLIERAPDKMIDYFDGFIMLAFRGVVVYIDVTKHKIDDETSHEMIEHTISEESNLIRLLNLNRRYKIICI